MRGYTFSIILYVDEKEKFAHALYCLNQAAGDEKIQLIVADPFADPQIAAACSDFKGGFVAYFELPDMQMAEAYQTGLAYVKGDYVNFALASSSFSENTFSAVRHAFKKYSVNMVSASPYFIDENETLYGGTFYTQNEATFVQLLQDSQSHHIQLLLQAYFIKREALEDLHFHPDLKEDALYQFLCTLQLQYPEYVYLGNVFYRYTVPLEDNHSKNHMQYQYDWYENSVRNFAIPLLKSSLKSFRKVPAFLQVSCFYLIYAKIRCNTQDRNKGILKTKEEVDQFFNAVFEALTYIDNSIIIQRKVTDNLLTLRSMRMFLLRGKAKYLGKEFKIEDLNNTYVAFLEPREEEDFEQYTCVIKGSNKELLKIDTINYEDGMLHLDASSDLTQLFGPDDFRIYAVCIRNGVVKGEFQPEYTEIYPLLRCFGMTYMRKRTVRFDLPVSDGDKETFRFYYTCAGKEHSFRLNFSAYNSRISTIQESYWVYKKGRMLRTNLKKTELISEKCGFVLQMKKEIKICYQLYKNEEYRTIRRRGILLRILYWMLLPFYRGKNIWVSYDKLYKGGDNGEYMFQYVRQNHRDIPIYYIMRKDSPDYKRLAKKHHRHILKFGSLRCQLIFLYAKIILATHVNIPAQYNPDPIYQTFTKDLQRGDVICIQHGLSIQKIAQYQNRVYDNTKLYCCASPYEVKNISHPIYGYSEDQLKLTGLARYDGLKNRDQKIILITPTWRRNIVNSGVVNIKKTHNENFKNSAYFQVYNRLINDETLINCAKQHGYRIVYLLHPQVSAQIDDFTQNDYVELIPGTEVDYEDILCESSLMVTDYTGIQFDFAYMRKPLIYYQPSSLPPHYEEGGLIYETMGFGPICKEHKEVVDAICKAIESNCQMEEEYRKRADDFFAFDDHQNCERIFEAVREYQG